MATVEQFKAFKALASGLSIPQAAVTVGVSKKTLRRWVREHNEEQILRRIKTAPETQTIGAFAQLR